MLVGVYVITMVQFDMNWEGKNDNFHVLLTFEFVTLIIVNKYVTEISAFLFWTTIFYSTLYVVLIVATLNLCNFLVGEPNTIDISATEHVASKNVDSAAIVGQGQTTQPEFLTPCATRGTTTITNNVAGITVLVTILSCTVGDGGGIVLSSDVSREPQS